MSHIKIQKCLIESISEYVDCSSLFQHGSKKHIFFTEDGSGNPLVLKINSKKQCSALCKLLLNHKFKNESLVLQAFEAPPPPVRLIVPKLVASDNKNYLIQERLNGVSLKRGKPVPSMVAEAVHEFIMAGGSISLDKFLKVWYQFFGSKGFSIVFRAFYLFREPLLVFKILRVYFYCRQSSPPQQTPWFQHGDLWNSGNSILLPDGKGIGFIDFGQVRNEYRYIFYDVVALVVDHDLSVQSDLFWTCVEQLSPMLETQVDIKAQVRIALLHRLLEPRTIKNTDSVRFRFLKYTLLQDQAFDLWYQQNFYVRGE